ncbi:hypothetical protein AVEN_29012-1 [Araneus ventricosus]|uniref:Uncharacterized protein n=1 Tax=Araneus ventricosus TaxID=182803 RepID=A0A4Y2AJE5_ARAVE|nr:hypothetical protein AVEN_29012-1 [Araneus ventricosus]
MSRKGGSSLLHAPYLRTPSSTTQLRTPNLLPTCLQHNCVLPIACHTARRNKKSELEEKQRLEVLAETRRKEKLEEKQRQEALAELRRKDKVELERLKIEAQFKLGTTTTEADYSKLPSKEVSKFLHRFEVKEDISLYLILFERQVHRLHIPKEHWVSYLLGLLPPEISHVIAREPDEKADDYDHVKELLLNRFKLTPEKFRQLVSTHQKAYNRTWTDYYHKLATYFDGWILGLKIETYEDLRKLIINIRPDETESTN